MVNKLVMKKKIIDQDLRDAAGKSATETHPICMVTVDDTTFDTNHNKMIAHFHGFIAGSNWQKEQSATDAVEMLQWLVEQDNAVLLYEGLIQHKASAKELSKQLYKLWQKSKNNANK
jgi:hypothetical protein